MDEEKRVVYMEKENHFKMNGQETNSQTQWKGGSDTVRKAPSPTVPKGGMLG